MIVLFFLMSPLRKVSNQYPGTISQQTGYVESMLAQRLRRWANIKPTLVQRMLFAVQPGGSKQRLSHCLCNDPENVPPNQSP